MNTFSTNNMEIEFIEDTKYRAVFKIKGVGHSFTNALKKELWNDKTIKISAYNVEHPLVGVPLVIVETSSGKKEVRQAILDAVERLKKINKDFLTKFK